MCTRTICRLLLCAIGGRGSCAGPLSCPRTRARAHFVPVEENRLRRVSDKTGRQPRHKYAHVHRSLHGVWSCWWCVVRVHTNVILQQSAVGSCELVCVGRVHQCHVPVNKLRSRNQRGGPTAECDARVRAGGLANPSRVVFKQLSSRCVRPMPFPA